MITETTQSKTKAVKSTSAASGANSSPKTDVGGDRAASRRPSFKKGGPRGQRSERVKPEYEQKMISIRRVTRVVSGGRRFSFSVSLVVGNKRGVVGVGVGKAGDTSLAIQKAYNAAKKSLVKINLEDNHSIPYEVKAKYNSAEAMLMPNDARGLVAGSSVRIVLELAGVKDVTGKVLSRSKNQLNNARATIKALAPFSTVYRKEETKEEVKVADEKATKNIAAKSKTESKDK